MSNIKITGDMNLVNAQIGDENVQYNENNDINASVDWDLLLNELRCCENTDFQNQKESLVNILNNKDKSESSSFIKRHFSEFCLGVFTELSSLGLIEIIKLFI